MSLASLYTTDCTGVSKTFRDPGVPRGQIKGSSTVFRSRVRVCTESHQESRRGVLIFLARPMQWRFASGIPGIDFCALRDEVPDRTDLPAPCSIMDGVRAENGIGSVGRRTGIQDITDHRRAISRISRNSGDDMQGRPPV